MRRSPVHIRLRAHERRCSPVAADRSLLRRDPEYQGQPGANGASSRPHEGRMCGVSPRLIAGRGSPCGCSSAGRAPPCQGGARGFGPRHPLEGVVGSVTPPHHRSRRIQPAAGDGHPGGWQPGNGPQAPVVECRRARLRPVCPKGRESSNLSWGTMERSHSLADCAGLLTR